METKSKWRNGTRTIWRFFVEERGKKNGGNGTKNVREHHELDNKLFSLHTLSTGGIEGKKGNKKGDKKGSMKDKKCRRSKRNQNKFKKLKVYYANVRGIKSKITSMKEIIKEIKPHIICLTETKLGKDENIKIDGYHFENNNNEEGKGGVTIGLCNEIRHMGVVLEKVTLEYETIWIKLSNEHIKIRIGNIYAPQESRTEKKVFEEMYRHICEQNLEAEKQGEKILILGDFNCKIGECIKGNRKEVTKSGKMLKKMVQDEGLKILNATNKTVGVWTRIEGETRSIIDYCLISEESLEYVEKMEIDEKKDFTPFNITGDRMIYSDHCAITVTINWLAQYKEECMQNIQVSCRETMNKFNYLTQNCGLREIAESNMTIQEKYTQWDTKIKEIKNMCFNKQKKHRKSQSIPGS